MFSLRRARRTVARCAVGIVFGVALFLTGGITWTPDPPPCHGCAVLVPSLAHDCPGGAEVVQGGVICG